MFSEEQGIGTIQISGTAGVVARVVGGTWCICTYVCYYVYVTS